MINRAFYALPYSLLRPGAGLDDDVDAAVDVAVDQAGSSEVVVVDCTAPADKAGAAGYTAQVVIVM